MASKHIVSIEVATEGAYGSVGTAGYPDGTGLGAWASMEIADRAQIVPIGDAVQVDRMDPRTGAYGIAPEPIIPGAGVSPVRRATLTVDTYFRPRGAGTVYPTYSTHPVYRLLRTRFGVLVAPLVSASDPVAGLIDANSHTPTVIGDYTDGQIFRHSQGATLSQYSAVTEATAVGPLVTYSPALAAALAAAQVVCPLTTLYILPQAGIEPAGMALQSVALRLRGDGWEAIAYGCTLTGLTITGADGDGRTVRLSMTIDCPWVEYDSTPTAPVVPTYADGQLCHSLGSPVVISEDVAGFTAPEALAREYTPCADAWTCTIAWQTTAPGCGSSWLGRGRLEANAIDVDLELFLHDYSDDYAADWAGRLFRQVMLGFSAYDGAANEGGALFLPSAYLKEEPIKPDVGTDLLRTRLHYGAGRYSGDVGVNDGANSSLRLAWG
jgi:hypothetical protein